MDDKELIEILEQQAAEIAKEGHAGWGNTMMAAAERIRDLCCEREGMTAAADSLLADVYSVTERTDQ